MHQKARWDICCPGCAGSLPCITSGCGISSLTSLPVLCSLCLALCESPWQLQIHDRLHQGPCSIVKLTAGTALRNVLAEGHPDQALPVTGGLTTCGPWGCRYGTLSADAEGSSAGDTLPACLCRLHAWVNACSPCGAVLLLLLA